MQANRNLKRWIVAIIAVVIASTVAIWLWSSNHSSGTDPSLISLRQHDGQIQYRYPSGDWRTITTIQALRGEQGKQGEAGKTGDKGDDGKDGRDGNSGQTGTAGATGVDGRNGKDGAPGADGQDGIIGRDGDDGADGDTGPGVELQKGSEYIEWRWEGESTWRNLIAYADLRGEKGDTGEQGPQGLQGIPGQAASLTSMAHKWTNLVTNGTFALDSNSDGLPDGFSKAAGYTITRTEGGPYGHIITLADASGKTSLQLNRSLSAQTGHLYYHATWARTTAADVSAVWYTGNLNDNTVRSYLPPTGKWEFVSGISKQTGTNVVGNLYMNKPADKTFSVGDTVDMAGWVTIDLTDTYGEGNEPTSAEMDRIVSRMGPWDGVAGEKATTQAVAALAMEPRNTSREDRLAAGVFRVGSWNIQGYTERPYVAAWATKQIDADILALQEAWQAKSSGSRPDLDAQRVITPNRSLHWQQSVDYSERWLKGRATLSALRLESQSWLPTPAQGVLRSEVVVLGRRVAIYNVHLPWTANVSLRRTYIQNHFNLVASDPAPYKIIVGDFNTPDDVQTAPPIDSSSLEPLTDAGYKHLQVASGWMSTRNANPSLLFYGDNIFLSPGLEFTGSWGTFGLPDTYDHQPIWADVRFSEATPVQQMTSPDGSRWQATIGNDGVVNWLKLP